MDADKYPQESGRRRFVKGLVGGSVLGGVGVAGSGFVNTATSQTGVGGGSVEAKVIENTDGPAPRGMSQVPVTIEDGYLTGVWPDVDDEGEAKMELGGVEYSSKWFQTCGVEAHPKVKPGSEADDFLRSPEKARYGWESDLETGERLHVDQFADYEDWHNGIGERGLGKPASATWRSQETEKTIPVQVLRSPHIEAAAEDDDWLAASTEKGFIAWLNKCTHFCCVPAGFKKTTSIDGAENAVYCQCHQSIYDPLSVVSAVFKAKPRPAD